MLLYILSFIILFIAELCGTVHYLFAIKNNKHGMALMGGLSSAFWCIKIVVIINQPFSIITGFMGAYLGTWVALIIDSKIKTK